MEDLINKRGVIKGKVTRLQNYFATLDKDKLTDSEIKSLTLRLENVEHCLKEFEDIQLQIEILDKNEIEKDTRENFEMAYFALIGNVGAILDKYGQTSSAIEGTTNVNTSLNTGVTNSGVNSNFVKLPTIKLPTFDGQYENFLEFRDAFKAIVDSNESLSAIQKFIYLRSALEKDALQVIKSIEVVADNYAGAWKILVDRFENKKLMVHSHIRAIFEQSHVQKECHLELRKLFDNVNKHLRALKTLGEDTESWDRLIIYVTSGKFDNTTRRDWESYKYEGDLPTMKDLEAFLRQKCEILEKLEVSNEKVKQAHPKSRFSTSSSMVANTSVQNNLACYFCGKNHPMYKCELFLKLNVVDRIAEVRKRTLCVNCFRDSHSSWQCRARKCVRCNKPHNVLLHLENVGNRSPSQSNQQMWSRSNGASTAGGSANRSAMSSLVPEVEGPSVGRGVEDRGVSSARPPVTLNNHTVETCMVTRPETVQVLLATAQVNILINDKLITCRALLDGGSQSHFISEKLCKKLNVPVYKVNHVVKGVGQALANINKQVNITIRSMYNNFTASISCLVLTKITEKLPTVSVNKNAINIPANLSLADPNFNMSSEVDMLLGSDVFWSVIRDGKRHLGKNMPVLQNTQLGWVIAGNFSVGTRENSSLSHLLIDSEESVDKLVQRFWQIEEVGDNKRLLLSKNEKYCEDYFKRTTERDETGRFIVKIPFKESVSKLGNSKDMAIKRFYSLERRLVQNPELKVEYSHFMSEYEKLGHMSEVVNDTEIESGYYLPHHAVIKTASLTTKCRVVFDASAKTDTGLSLNDVQFNGPKIQNDIFSILVRFRKYNFVLTADISKMYRQVLIDGAQRGYQKILWRRELNESLKCYQLNTVTYGTASGPYLAVRSLFQLGIDNEIRFPVASDIIKNDFYVDDLLTGAHSTQEVLHIQKEVSSILASAGFELRKWLCNDQTILNEFQINKDLDVSVLPIGEQGKLLGVCWNSERDLIQYSINISCKENNVTKRIILSTVSQIYDPLGLLGPIIIVGKLLIQELWKKNLTWDEKVPPELCKKWNNFKNDLPYINEILIPRHVVLSQYTAIELHGFSDASEKAYGACIYIRCVGNGHISSKLLCSKSRVAPLKVISLPRLELCGALLLANLARKVIDSIKINFDGLYFFTDSSVTLAWINGAPTRWKTFVANRVSEIQSLTESSDWYHINTHENPADLISRGESCNSLSNSDLWWYGPDFLLRNSSEWNFNKVNVASCDIPELRTVSVVSIKVEFISMELINKYSSISHILRVMAYVLRFISNLKSKQKVYGPISAREMDEALIKLVRDVQKLCFSNEYFALANNKELSKGSKILSLNPFMHNSLIRVGGRIINSNQSFNKRHPILLPHSHRLTELIIENEHKLAMHCGAQALLCNVREQFWPISGRNICKKVIKKCIICFKARPVPAEYLMGDLPDVRVNRSHPFLNVGVDYGGPFLLKDRSTRGAKITKAYICLFICMCTKAVHIELVSELTTRAFLATLNRFVSRRGKPLNIFSDNGLNFVGANNEIGRMYEFLKGESTEIANQLVSQHRIQWHFIPARSPTFGGIWEAGIKSAKFHIKRVINNHSMTFEEFNTVLTKIESILNSRPLCPLTSDPNDLTALTPAHFLIGRSLVAVPEVSMVDVSENRLNKYQRIQAMYQQYWCRWQKEYLAELQTRTKWKQRSNEILKIGSLVLVKHERAAVQEWLLGRVTALHPGKDGITRVVDIRVRGGEIRRALTCICVLPIDN